MESPSSKPCSKCHQEKPLDQYGAAKRGKYGKRAECNDCRKQYYQDNAESIKQAAKDWYHSNQDRAKERTPSASRITGIADAQPFTAVRLRPWILKLFSQRQMGFAICAQTPSITT